MAEADTDPVLDDVETAPPIDSALALKSIAGRPVFPPVEATEIDALSAVSSDDDCCETGSMPVDSADCDTLGLSDDTLVATV